MLQTLPHYQAYNFTYLQILCLIRIPYNLHVRCGVEPTGVLFLISSQDTTYHRPLAARLRDDIINQAESQLPNTNYIITVHMLHEIFNFPSYWAIKNAIPLVRSKLLGEHVKWVVWLEESTHVLLQALLEQLVLEDATRVSEELK